MQAKYLGFDLSTTALSVGVRSEEGEEGFASVPIKGATLWHGQPAFDLDFIPGMMELVFNKLLQLGWEFKKNGALSFSVRQHDMVLLNAFGDPIAPALSWQCNVAVKEVRYINDRPHLVSVVGKVEERFILPKLMWALGQDRSLNSSISMVMATGDYIAFRLTGKPTLSSSDAMSNGLLSKVDKKNADSVFLACHLDPKWFPPVENSCKVVRILDRINSVDPWFSVCCLLNGWKVVSSLGDNHAGAVGCGLNSDQEIVISAGTSGTVVRMAHPQDRRLGKTATFEYYDEELLLLMLARCASWYEDFASEYHPGKSLKRIDEDLLHSFKNCGYLPLRRVKHKKQGDELAYESLSSSFSPAQQTANVQASIALELLLLLKKMMEEVTEPEAEIKKVILTGGLSKSLFFQEVLRVGVGMLQNDLKLYISAHEGALAHKAAVLGALINAMVGDQGGNVQEKIGELCPVSEIPPRDYISEYVAIFLKDHLM